jgi:hypothetical protein
MWQRVSFGRIRQLLQSSRKNLAMSNVAHGQDDEWL